MTSPTPASSTAARGDAPTLTPSEQLLLAASAPAADATERRLATPDADAVVRAVAAALLANEQAGHLAFEAGTRKKWLGLKTVAALYARPSGGASAPWPADSLEAKTLDAARKLQPKGKHHVGAVAEASIPYCTEPQAETASLAWQAMRPRGAVEQVTREKKTLGVFKSKESHDVLTPAGEALLRDGGDASARALVAACERARPDLWRTLVAETAAAFTRQTQPENNGDNDFGSSD